MKTKLNVSAVRGHETCSHGPEFTFMLLIFETFPHSYTVFHKQETLQQEKRRSLYKFAEIVPEDQTAWDQPVPQ